MDQRPRRGKHATRYAGVVPHFWQLLGDRSVERTRFADLATTLQQPASAAGPANRFRSVRCIATAEGTWFCKQFATTQWRNRWRFRCTRPFARCDAERELRMAQALLRAGIPAPEPVAFGRAGRASYFVCRALPGQSLATRLASAPPPAALCRAVAEFCGAVLRQGFWLPDLSAEHVFVTGQPERPFALLDLHNGRLAPAGRPPRWLLRRVLRHFARSVRGLPVAWAGALRFAARLLRAAGARDATRHLLRSLPPFHTAARYGRPGKSRAYAERNPARTARELRLLERIWPGQAGERVLDLPCGAGRLWPLLRRLGHPLLAGDAAPAMLQEARAQHADAPPLFAADATAMPLAARAVAGVVLFRFLHHLPPAARNHAIAEACRLADRFVVVSFFHPCSAHALRRRFGELRGRPRTRHAIRLGELRAQFAQHGFQRLAHTADLAYVRDLWVAAFERTPTPPARQPGAGL
ncbi:MAG: methyltransferase domain-containing protein [Planctomycetes bacterium]|nr:methyltransferase domain-containing protein [Planctomycetota bacterium]